MHRPTVRPFVHGSGGAAVVAVLLAGAATLAVSGGSEAAVLLVGGDAACDTSSIASALLTAALSSGPDEIRLARNITYTNQYLHLTDWDPAGAGALTIRGGYDSCSDTTPNGITTLIGRAGDPVVEVDTSSATSVVTLYDLEFFGSGQAGVLVEGASHVDLFDCAAVGNAGGGLVATTGAVVEVDFYSSMTGNSATSGAGIRCDGATVTTAGYVFDNTAGSSGGGVYATNGCTFTVDPGCEIVENHALWGGGIYASGGSQVTVDGRASSVATSVSHNQAANQGGGIYANGAGTSVTVNNASVESNQAGSDGGGLFAVNGGTVAMDRIDGICLDAVRCSRLTANLLTTAGNGSAAAAMLGGHVQLHQTYVEGNSGPGNLGFLLYASGAGSRLDLEGLQLWGNGTVSLLQGESQAVIRAGFLTAAMNQSGSGQPRSLQLDSSATASIYSSVLWDTTGISTGSGGAVTQADCLIVNTVSGLPVSATAIGTDPPQFRGASRGDLHLKVASPAVDYCDTFYYTPEDADGDQEVRGYDLAENPDGDPGVPDGVYDIGFDEVYYFFEDGFETGSTAGWSSQVP